MEALLTSSQSEFTVRCGAIELIYRQNVQRLCGVVVGRQFEDGNKHYSHRTTDLTRFAALTALRRMSSR